MTIFKLFFKKQFFVWLAFLLLLPFSLFFSACSCGVKVEEDKKSSSSVDMITITTTNTITNHSSIMSNLAGLQALERSVPIDSLRNKMFVWLDASIPSFFSLNDAGKLTNWLDRNNYTIQTNFITNNVTTNITTNTTTSGNTVSNTIVNTIGFSVALSYDFTSPLSATPKSDVTSNETLGLVVSNTAQASNNYVLVDYEGDDRVGFKIDTSSLADSQQVAAFYLVTEWVQGNNRWHVPLGYDNLGHQKRFLTKKQHEQIYLAEGRNESKAGLTLNEENVAREKDFSVPNTIHLLSATNLGISKANLNGILGTFPHWGDLGGAQKIRELIIFTNDLTALDHSNMVRYLVEKWHIPRHPVVTNLSSYYGHKNSDVIENAIDNNSTTTFYLNNAPQNAVNGRLLFQFKLSGTVLDPSALLSASRGVSTGHPSLVLKTGNKAATDTLKAPVKVELLRKADVLAGNNSWYTLTNVAADNNNGVKTLVFNLLAASNDFIGYRLLATGNVNTPNWLQIDDFVLSRTSPSSPQVTSLANILPGGKIYNTNDTAFSHGFTNTLTFDQDVYGLAASDFQVSNGSIQSLVQNSPSNYSLVIKPFSFQSNSVGQSLVLKITLPEAAVTNASGGVNHGYGKSIAAFTVFNPFGKSEFDVGEYSTPTFVDLDGDGDQDMVSGEYHGGFVFFSNTGNNRDYTKYGKNDARNPFSGAAFDVGDSSRPTFVDLDGDGDQDLISGDENGGFVFISNTGNNRDYTKYDKNHAGNPFSGAAFGVGGSSTPTFVDLDGDLDLISGEENGGFVFISNTGNNRDYTKYGKNDARNPFSGATFDVGAFSSPTFVDLDGDGDLDLISGELNGDFVFISNTGNNRDYSNYGVNDARNPFSGATFDVGTFSSPTFVDLDGDGDIDMISGESGGGFVYFMNVGGVFLRAE